MDGVYRVRFRSSYAGIPCKQHLANKSTVDHLASWWDTLKFWVWAP